MEAEIPNALACIANDGALGCVIDAGSYSKIRMTRYHGLALYLLLKFIAGVIVQSKMFLDLVV
jgi:hypothetical protein